MRFRLQSVLAAMVVLSVVSAVTARSASPPPNFVVLFADDLGYGDLGCYGHPSIRTPHLDRMAAEGLRFTDFYSAAEVCTPSRAALLTGRYPVRSGMSHSRYRVLRRNSVGGLPAGELTVAEALQGRGYATACIGKWHLGVFARDPSHHPRRHGFDHFLGLPHSNDMDPSGQAPPGAPRRLDQDPAWWNAPLFRNETCIEQPADQTRLTQRYTEEAVAFIREHRRRPFFLYLPHSFPHVPLFASEAHRGRSPRGLYGDVVEELDASVGAILEELRRWGLDRRTLVIFTSDNGPWLTQGLAGGSAGLLREGKGSTWEGGMRVPAIAWWPGRVPAGRTTRDLACMLDLFPTFLSLAGVPLPADRVLDGVDLTSVLLGRGESPRRSFFYYRGSELYAVRSGVYKAHFTTRSAYGPDQPVVHDPPLLFDLGADPGEAVNIAGSHPEILAGLRDLVAAHQAGVEPVPSQLEAVAPPPGSPPSVDASKGGG